MRALDEIDVESVRRAFSANFDGGMEQGASFAVWDGSGPLVELHGGWRDREGDVAWDAGTLALLWSATKPLEAVCVLRAIEEAGLSLESRVSLFWPEFGAEGKGDVTVGDVLAHRAGIPALDDPRPSILEHDAVVTALARQKPFWVPGRGHGYHVRVFGFLCDEIVRRTSGLPLATAWRAWFAEPLGLDIWIGLPEALHPRAAEVLAPRSVEVRPGQEAFFKAYNDPGHLTHRAFRSPRGLGTPASMNAAEIRAAAVPSLGAIGNACALAKFFAMLAGDGCWQGRRYLPAEVMQSLRQPVEDHASEDRVLCLKTAFVCGFMKTPCNEPGSALAEVFGAEGVNFGHPGAGGILGLAEPATGRGYAYVMNAMRTGVLPDERSIGLLRAAGCS